MTKDEALKLALEALQEVYWSSRSEKHDEAITAIRSVLAQPDVDRRSTESKETFDQQEPVATVAEVHMSRYTIEWTNGPLPEGTKLYTTPPQRTWVGLTDEEMDAAWHSIFWASDKGLVELRREFARAIEAAHGIKE